MRRRAVHPKLTPSFHASLCTRNHTPRSPVWAQRNSWKASAPRGDSAGAIHARQSRWRRQAIQAATAQAAQMAMAFGRLAVATAAAMPARSHRSSSSSRRVAPTSASMSASL